MAANDRFDAFTTNAIRDLLADSGNQWVGLVDLRPILDLRGISRDTQDQHLRRMSAEGKIHLATEANRKALTDADHAAAIIIGGEPNHIIALA